MLNNQNLPLDMHQEKLDGTEREYNIKCKIKVIKHFFFEEADGKYHETTSVFLIPDFEAGETAMFLNAWLPDSSTVCLDCSNSNLMFEMKTCPKCQSKRIHTPHSEVATFLPYPVNSPCRMAVMRKNNRCNQHHLFVMSSGVEDDLRRMDGKSIYVKCFPGTEDVVADSAKDISRSRK